MKAEQIVSTTGLPHPPIRIFFEDPHLIVLSKPPGLLSQGEKTGEPNLVDILRVYFGRNYVGLIHRLDRATSGLMVVAKRTKSARRLTEALQSGDIQRTYLGWVMGKLPKEVSWSHSLHKDERTNTVKVVRSGGKPSILRARPVQYSSWNSTPCTLAEFILETGRSHQIRVQAAHEGFPLLGDAKYGAPRGFSRVALHSHRLEFPHPMSGETMQFEDPLPQDLILGSQSSSV